MSPTRRPVRPALTGLVVVAAVPGRSADWHGVRAGRVLLGDQTRTWLLTGVRAVFTRGSDDTAQARVCEAGTRREPVRNGIH